MTTGRLNDIQAAEQRPDDWEIARMAERPPQTSSNTRMLNNTQALEEPPGN